jgi:hypothetical protein
MIGGKGRQMGLGPFPDVTLAGAREAAQQARAAVRNGFDPIEARRKAKAEARATVCALTLRQVADKYIAAHEAAWRNEKHRWQWGQTLDLACKTIGQVPVGSIATGDVMCVLEPIWRSKPETASRLRGRIESVLDYATAHGWRKGENPARWRGHLAKLLPAPSKLAEAEHKCRKNACRLVVNSPPNDLAEGRFNARVAFGLPSRTRVHDTIPRGGTDAQGSCLEVQLAGGMCGHQLIQQSLWREDAYTPLL